MIADATRSGLSETEFRWDIPRQFNFGSDVVDRIARENDHAALIWCDAAGREERYSFSNMARLTNRCANLLAAAGLRRGDRMIVMLPRLPQWQIAMVGCMKLGAVPIPCVEMLTERDIRYRIEHSGARAAITTVANIGKFPAWGEAPDIRISIGGGAGWSDYETLLSEAGDQFSAAPLAADDPAILYYTSGSSGHPKGVLHATRAIFAWRVSARFWLDVSERVVIWCTADTGWSKAGTSVLFGPWSEGATVLFHDGPFDPKRRLELLERYRVTVFCASASELRRLAQEDVRSHDLAALRHTVSAGEAVSPALVEQWTKLTGVPLVEGYGQTETLMTATNRPREAQRSGSTGRALVGTEIVIIGDGGVCLPAGEVGTIAVALPNPQIMLGYWREPGRSEAMIVRNEAGEWFMTGDLGHMDEAGYVYFDGRADDLINSAGYRIGPLEVENTLAEHPAVLECAVVPSPDPERGEVVKAFVVLRPNWDPSGYLVRELQDHAKRLTAPYKYPRRIEFIDALPKTATGKVSRRTLRDREFARNS